MHKNRLAAVLLIVCSLTHAHVSLAGDIFLAIQATPPLQGESVDAGHKNWTDILSVTWGHVRPAGIDPRQLTRVEFAPLSIVKYTDSTSPRLAMAAALGETFPSAVVESTRVVGGKQVAQFRLELFDVRVTEYSASASRQAGAERPIDELKLSYGKIRWITTSYDGKPAVGGWDLGQNKVF